MSGTFEPCSFKASGTDCSDGNACTTGDRCDGAGNCSGSTVVCQALDQCHDAGTCDPFTGCSNPPKANGTPCSDGTACTRTDSCQAGTCVGSNPVICTALDQCHDVGSCDPATGNCSNPAKANGAPCSDGNACTRTDTCQAGTCVGTNPVTCTALDQCHDVGSCDPVTGNCSNPAKANGTPCNDGDACTYGDGCSAGQCVGTLISCTSDLCMARTCNGTSSCSQTPTYAACDDGNPCTGNDTCNASGQCVGTPVARVALSYDAQGRLVRKAPACGL